MQNQPHVDSWYAASVKQQLDFPPLLGETTTDVCVIGSGYTGLSTAIHLRQLGLEAVDTVSQLIEQYNIDCEFKRGNLHVASKAKETADLQAEVDHLQQVYDYQQIRYVDKSELAQMTCGQGFHGGTVDTGARHLHPLNYALGLARRLIRDDTSMSDTLFVINYWKLSADIKNFVRKCMLRIYPELEGTRIDYGWGGTLAITMNRMPDFGRLSANVFYAQGFSGHGVPTATMAGKLLAEVISGTAERFDIMATVPSPTFPGGTLLRWPGQVTGMLFYSLRDRLG